MRDSIDLNMLANWVTMMRADVDGAIWLVDHDFEGRFYEKCANSASRIVPSQNTALPLLNVTEQRGVAGLVAAIHRPEPEAENAENVFWPEFGDVASLLILSKCCDLTLEEVGGVPWLKASIKEVGTLRDNAIMLAWVIQQICLSHKYHPIITVIDDCIDWNVFDMSIPKVISKFGPDAEVAIDSLREKARKMTKEEMLKECDGMNVVIILAKATHFFRPRGIAPYQVVNANEFLRLLRVTFDFEEFEHDQIFWRMRHWERRNPQYPLLREWRQLDPLQVVWDQRYWERDLKLMLETDTKQKGLTAFKLDLDNFKTVNDKLGHSGGDEAIRLYCRIVRECIAHSGETYRRGGDEVVAFAPGLLEADATVLAERIRCRIENEFKQWGGERGLSPTPTASIGVVVVNQGSSFEKVNKLMDETQSRAKKEGKNRVILMLCSEG